MANYPRPGVYVEEFLNPISDVAIPPGSSAAAFVGVSTGGGPVGPVFVTSWAQYQALYGGIGTSNDDLSYAVYTFFANAGAGCYVVRAVNADATAATLTVNDTQGTPAPSLVITASAPGTWASASTSSSRVYITIQPSTPVGRFDLIVEVGTGTLLAAREQFIDLTMDPTDGRYAVDVINSPVVGSKYVTVSSSVTAYASNKNPAAATKTPLTGGSEGTGSPNLVTATSLLDTLDQNLVVNVPGASSADLSTIVTWAGTSGKHFVVADVPKPATNETPAAGVTAMTTLAAALPASSHVAVYGPWVYVADPGSRAGAMRLTAPGGSVVGQYVRTDAARGVHKAPAGTATVLSSVLAPAHVFTGSQEDTLFAASVNVIKKVPGSGTCIMGARTKSAGFPDRYISVRRMLISLKSTLTSLAANSIFENNDEDLWETLEAVIAQYLDSRLEIGALKGSTPAEAYYVRCDSTNNNAQTIAAGVVNIEVGVALQQPAEFIVIRLGQTVGSGAANVSDSLEE